MKNIIRYPADLRSVVFLILASISYLGIVLFPIGFSSLFFFILSYIFGLSVVSIAHFHGHLGISKFEFLNRAIDIWLAILMGRSGTWSEVTHNLNHHVHSGSGEDWMGQELYHAEESFAFTRYVFRCFKNVKIQKPKLGTQLLDTYRKKSLPEVLGIWIFIGFVLSTNPMALILIAAIWIGINFFLFLVNLFQHYECDISHTHAASRNFGGNLFNYLLVNSGYHTGHHENPKIHWSLLPKKHLELHDKIPSSLQGVSFASYAGSFLLKSKKVSKV